MKKVTIIKSLICLLIFINSSNYTYSQCIEENTDYTQVFYGYGGQIAQSFVADCTGVLNTIELQWFKGDVNFSIVVYIGSGEYVTEQTQVGSTISNLNSIETEIGTFQSYDALDSNIQLIAGQTYNFEIIRHNDSIKPYYSSQAYPGDGNMVSSGGPETGLDLVHKLTINNTLSVNKRSNLDNVNIFKSGYNTLLINNLNSNKVIVSIFSITGKKVFDSLKISPSVSLEIELINLTKGLYIIKIDTEKGVLSKKIML